MICHRCTGNENVTTYEGLEGLNYDWCDVCAEHILPSLGEQPTWEAEAKRLKSLLTHAASPNNRKKSKLTADRDRLAADNERLRAALEAIAAVTPSHKGVALQIVHPSLVHIAVDANEIARNALKGGE